MTKKNRASVPERISVVFLEDAMKRQHSTPHTPKIGLQEGVE